MFCAGQKVLYGSNGVCEIEDITEKKIGRERIEYYVLKPICSKSSTLFVPTHNEKLVAKIREVLSAEQIKEILSEVPDCSDWENDKLIRSESFRGVIAGADFTELIMLVRRIRLHAAKTAEAGKRLHVSDERFLREAEKMVCEEVSTAFDIDRDAALEMIIN